MTEPLLRLDVWRPVRPSRRLAYAEQVNDGPSVSVLQEDCLHEQAYSWTPKGDIWMALADTDKAEQIKEALRTDFSDSLPPEKRGFAEMKALVRKIKDYLAEENNRQWQSWEQPINDDQDNLYRMQPLLALYHHLKWLCEVFQDIPGASVTVR